MITFKNKYDGSLVMSQQTHAQEVTSHFPVARLVTIGHFQSEQSLVVVAQWEEHALSVSRYQLSSIKRTCCISPLVPIVVKGKSRFGTGNCTQRGSILRRMRPLGPDPPPPPPSFPSWESPNCRKKMGGWGAQTCKISCQIITYN